MFDYDTQLLPGRIAIVNVRGTLNDSNRGYFFDCVTDLIREGNHSIIVDCDGLGSISSSGLASLINARRRAESRGGRIYLTRVSSAIVEILNITKLINLFSIYDTTEQLLPQIMRDRSLV